MGLLGGEVGLEKHTTPPPKKKLGRKIFKNFLQVLGRKNIRSLELAWSVFLTTFALTI